MRQPMPVSATTWKPSRPYNSTARFRLSTSSNTCRPCPRPAPERRRPAPCGCLGHDGSAPAGSPVGSRCLIGLYRRRRHRIAALQLVDRVGAQARPLPLADDHAESALRSAPRPPARALAATLQRRAIARQPPAGAPNPSKAGESHPRTRGPHPLSDSSDASTQRMHASPGRTHSTFPRLRMTSRRMPTICHTARE